MFTVVVCILASLSINMVHTILVYCQDPLHCEFRSQPTIIIWLRSGATIARIVVGLVFQFPNDVPGKMILDFPMSWNGLAGTRAGILIPIMPPAVADENATNLFKLADEINPFHAN